MLWPLATLGLCLLSALGAGIVGFWYGHDAGWECGMVDTLSVLRKHTHVPGDLSEVPPADTGNGAGRVPSA